MKEKDLSPCTSPQERGTHGIKCLLVFLIFSFTSSFAQHETSITGKVIEQETNEGLPFVNVFYKGAPIGTVTDVEGNYILKTIAPKDSIYVSLIGYKTETRFVRKGQTQIINFQLKPSTLNLGAVEIMPGINPAIQIIKNTIKNKEKYNRDNLNSVQYLSYTKQEVDVDNVTERMRKRNVFSPITNMWDSLNKISDKKGETVLPVVMSEVISEIYAYKDGKKKHEDVNAVRVNFVGIKDGSAISRLTGTDFQTYNFCDNNVPILEKDFLSPIASNAFLFYNFYLMDTVLIDSTKCYQINVQPKNSKDLAYTGVLWITDSTFAIKQLDLEITKEVNFNLVDRVHIQQQLIPTEAGPWVPSQTKVTIDYTNITKKFVSVVVHTLNINSDFIVNSPKKKDFYDTRIQFAEDAITKDSLYWLKKRPAALTPFEIHSNKMIDTIRNIPFVKKAVNTIYFLFSGYKDVGPVDIGHFMQVYGHNYYEGNRLRLGFKTNEKFSKNWIIKSYGAYGFKDEKFKYNVQLERIITRYPWSRAGVQYRNDIDQIGVNNDFSRTMNLSQPPNYLYNMFAQIGNVRKLVRKQEYRFWYEKDFGAGVTTKITFQNIHNTPLFSAIFGDPLAAFQLTNYTVTEVALDARISKKERYIQNGLDRISLGNKKSPIITFNYTQGFKNILGGNFNYQKTSLSVSTILRMAALGNSKVFVKAGKVFSKIPFTSLEIPRGNQTFFYAENVFNLMNYFEFVSDQYIQLFWQHHFMGLIFNRIPLIKKMNLRETIGFNAIYGTLSNANKNFNSSNSFTVMTNKPYCEASAGIENIFDVVTLDFIYRLTYTDNTYKTNYSSINSGNTISNWGVKIGLKFSF